MLTRVGGTFTRKIERGWSRSEGLVCRSCAGEACVHGRFDCEACQWVAGLSLAQRARRS